MYNKILEKLELESIENGYQANIQDWNSWLEGNVQDFHSYKEWNGVEDVTRNRATLGMAKMGCEDWSDIAYNPETIITVLDSYQERLNEILSKNNFTRNINFGIEVGYGLGTLGIVTTLVDDLPNIEIVTADMMFPVYNDHDFGWAIISEYSPNTFYVSVHYEELKGKYKVENSIIKKVNDEIDVLSNEAVESEYGIKAEETYLVPMLQIIKPAIANNIDRTSPYGISVFANAIDELKGVDLAYSGMLSDIATGKRLTFSMVQNLKDIDGKPTFTNEEGYYIMQGDKTFADGTSIKQTDPTLKSEEYINYIQTNLNLFGRKLGFGDNAYTFENGSVYTNVAQVVSTNSKFFKRRQKFLVIVEEALEGMVRAIYHLDTGKLMNETEDISVQFDDSIIHDKDREDKELDFQYMNGMISEVYYWTIKKDLTEDQAIDFVKNQQRLKGLIELPEEEGGEE